MHVVALFFIILKGPIAECESCMTAATRAQVLCRGYTRETPISHVGTCSPLSNNMVTIHDNVACISHNDDIKGKIWFAEKRFVKVRDPTEGDDGMISVIKIAKEHRFGTFVRGKFAMYEHILQLRNKAVESLMAKHCHESEDPASTESAEMPKRRKTKMIDEIDAMIEIEVQVEGEEPVTMKVVATASDQNVLEMELTEANVGMLLKDPPADEEEFTPVVNQSNVRWLPKTHSLQVWYFDSGMIKWRSKTTGMKKIGTPVQRQERVDKAAKVLQTFYEQHHSNPNTSEQAGPVTESVVHDGALDE